MISVKPEYNKRKIRACFSLNNHEYKLIITDPKIEEQYHVKEDGEYYIEPNNTYMCVYRNMYDHIYIYMASHIDSSHTMSYHVWLTTHN